MGSTNDQNGLIGEKLGAYRIRSLIGDGAQASVFLASDEALKRPAAVKIFKSLNQVPELMHEARLVARLSHRNIVSVYAVDFDARVPFMAMEYAPETVFGLVKARGPLSVDTALRYVEHASAALAHAHERGVIHRDVKPSNMLLTETNELRLADFGLARLTKRSPSAQLVGTPRYMAPEVWEGLGGDERSDLYSLGACLYFMLVGHAPFDGVNLEELKRAHLQREVTYPVSLRPSVRQLISELLAKGPEDRPQTARAANERIMATLRANRRSSTTLATDTQLGQLVVDEMVRRSPIREVFTSFEATMLHATLCVVLTGTHFRAQSLLLREFVRRRPHHCFVTGRVRVMANGALETLAAEFGVGRISRPSLYDAVADCLTRRAHAQSTTVLQLEAARTLNGEECADLCELLKRLEGQPFTLQLACDAESAERLRTALSLSAAAHLAQWVAPPAFALRDTWPVVQACVAALPATPVFAFPAKLLIAAQTMKRFDLLPRTMEKCVTLAALLKLPVITSFTFKAAVELEPISTLADIPEAWRTPPETWPDSTTKDVLTTLNAEFDADGLER